MMNREMQDASTPQGYNTHLQRFGHHFVLVIFVLVTLLTLLLPFIQFCIVFLVFLRLAVTRVTEDASAVLRQCQGLSQDEDGRTTPKQGVPWPRRSRVWLSQTAPAMKAAEGVGGFPIE